MELVEKIRIDGAGSRVFLLHVLLYETNERSVCVKNGASEVVVLVGYGGVHVASLVKLIALGDTGRCRFVLLVGRVVEQECRVANLRRLGDGEKLSLVFLALSCGAEFHQVVFIPLSAQDAPSLSLVAFEINDIGSSGALEQVERGSAVALFVEEHAGAIA